MNTLDDIRVYYVPDLQLFLFPQHSMSRLIRPQPSPHINQNSVDIEEWEISR
jgi:hypothetical protein